MIVTQEFSFIDSPVSADSISKTLRIEDLDVTGTIFEVNGTGEFSVRFEMSPNGTDWYGIQELDNFSTDAAQSISGSINIFRLLRAKIDIGSSGTVSVCKLHCSKK